MVKIEKFNICLNLFILASVCVAANAQTNELELPVATIKPMEYHRLGCPEKLEGEKMKAAVDELNKSLTKLAAGENGPHFRLVRIHEASRTVVSGHLYRINADIVDDDDGAITKNCDIEIWTQPWLPNGNQVTFKCGREPELIRKHSA
ncbi:sarcocystatin-A-like [Haematobia irritans]|uniref:sarcocystatin-A-like n=1 Tax=Haematobia irritans TaxID=7368 RepID=UPI003F50996E